MFMHERENYANILHPVCACIHLGVMKPSYGVVYELDSAKFPSYQI